MAVGLRADDVKTFARDLRRVDRELAKELGKGHRDVARRVAEDAKSAGRSAYGRHASQVRGISGRGSQRKASIALNTGRTPRLLAAEFGTKKHMVFGRSRLASSMRRRVFPPWSGNQWVADAGPASGVGYAVHPTIRRWVETGRLADEYADAVMSALADAFPERG